LHGIGGDRGVVCNERRLKTVEGVTVCGKIVRRGIDETREVVMASRNVDGLEEVGEELPNPLQVIIGWCTNDGWELGGSVHDDKFGLLGHCHGAVGEGRRERRTHAMVE
jgi:hypothetical protein